MSKTIMFIHGAWVTPFCWNNFKTFFEAQGYECLTPSWPYLDNSVAELKRHPAPQLATLTIVDLVNHFDKKIRALKEPPILIGHSFGGLIVQLLMDRGLGERGVSLSPAPPRGIIPTPTAFINALPVLLSWRGWQKALTMSFKNFAKSFANALPADQMQAVYEAQIVPTPGRIFFQAALGIGNAVNFKNPNRAPLLIIGAEKDYTVPMSMVRANYRKQNQPSVRTEFINFPNHSHWLIAEPGWDNVATSIAEWLE